MPVEHEPRLFGEKRCTKCELVKNFYRFSADNEMIDGLSSWCRDCRSEARQKNYKKKSLDRGQIRHLGPAGGRQVLTFEDWEDVT